MKLRNIVFVFVLIICIWFTQTSWMDEVSVVEKFRGASLDGEVIYPIKAESVNADNATRLTTIDNSYSGEDVILGDNLELMASNSLLSELFGASIHQQEDGSILLEHSKKIEILDDAGSDGYVSVAKVCEALDIEYKFDETTYEGKILTGIEKGDLPTSYDLRDRKRVSSIRNQGSTSTCWAYAAMGAFESSLRPVDITSFDVEAMIKNESFSVDSSIGGTYTMALAYLLSGKGPVSTSDKNYMLREAKFYDSDDIDDIKWAIYQVGGVSTSIYASLGVADLSDTSYFNSRTNSYCYRGSSDPNHDVVIIGWDDSYSASNFNGNVPGDGAFICQNSWGEDFGEKGVFYVSYYDTNIGNQAVSYSKIDSRDNFTKIYQSDLCGYVGRIGYDRSKIYAANVFSPDEASKIGAVGFYALEPDTTYEVYVVEEFSDERSLASRVQVAAGSVSRAGYYTIDFDKDFSVEAGKDFAVVVVLDSPGTLTPMAAEYVADQYSANVDITDGRGYISSNGLEWESVEEKMNANLCLKAYAR